VGAWPEFLSRLNTRMTRCVAGGFADAMKQEIGKVFEGTLTNADGVVIKENRSCSSVGLARVRNIAQVSVRRKIRGNAKRCVNSFATCNQDDMLHSRVSERETSAMQLVSQEIDEFCGPCVAQGGVALEHEVNTRSLRTFEN
jgi:hypothetical protein